MIIRPYEGRPAARGGDYFSYLVFRISIGWVRGVDSRPSLTHKAIIAGRCRHVKWRVEAWKRSEAVIRDP
jgi:hypothetical protein